MQPHTPESLAQEAELYAKLLETTRGLIQVLNDNDEPLDDIPRFYERIQRRAANCLARLDNLLGE